MGSLREEIKMIKERPKGLIKRKEKAQCLQTKITLQSSNNDLLINI